MQVFAIHVNSTENRSLKSYDRFDINRPRICVYILQKKKGKRTNRTIN